MRHPIALRAAAVVVAAAGLISAPTVGSAYASIGTYTVDLHQAKDLPITATAFDEHGTCDTVPNTEDGWHFVLSGNDAHFVKLTVTFEPGGQQVITTFGPPSDKHAYVGSAKGAKLTAATAEVSGGDVDKLNFNLSHTCPATGTGSSESPKPSESPSGSPKSSESPSPSPKVSASESPSGSPSESPSGSPKTSQSPSGSPSGSGSPSPSGAAFSPSASASSGPDSGSLAFTGASVIGTTVVGLALLGAGGVLVTRRRKGAHR